MQPKLVESLVVMIRASLLMFLLAALLFVFVGALLGFPLYFSLGIVAFVLVFNSVVAYFSLRAILARVMRPSDVGAA